MLINREIVYISSLSCTCYTGLQFTEDHWALSYMCVCEAGLQHRQDRRRHGHVSVTLGYSLQRTIEYCQVCVCVVLGYSAEDHRAHVTVMYLVHWVTVQRRL